MQRNRVRLVRCTDPRGGTCGLVVPRRRGRRARMRTETRHLKNAACVVKWSGTVLSAITARKRVFAPLSPLSPLRAEFLRKTQHNRAFDVLHTHVLPQTAYALVGTTLQTLVITQAQQPEER
jgi:hypothetical protein